MAEIPPLHVLGQLPYASILSLCYGAGGHCNGSLSYGDGVQTGPDVFVGAARAFAGFRGCELLLLVRWLGIRHRLRNTLGIHRYVLRVCALIVVADDVWGRLIAEHRPIVTVWMRDGTKRTGRLCKENQKFTELETQDNGVVVVESGSVIIMEWLTDVELVWLMSNCATPSWTGATRLSREAIDWPTRVYWAQVIHDRTTGAKTLCYDDGSVFVRADELLLDSATPSTKHKDTAW